MKKLLFVTLLSVLFGLPAQSTYAVSYSDGQFPDELSSNGLPDALPCIMTEPNYGMRLPAGETKILRCTWISHYREIVTWDQQQGRQVRYPNQHRGICRKGVCHVNGVQQGNLPNDLTFVASLWYYIGLSTDGKPVAYKYNTGPTVGQPGVSYAQAGQALVNFWEMAGIGQADIENSLGSHYLGGWKQFQADIGGNQPPTSSAPANLGEIKEAWCNPRMDDDCSINGEQIPMADLGKYLPSVDPAQIEAADGICEYPICYDKDGKPIGVRKSF
ncbi:hypothetical protein [Pseudomonas aeruginosa]|uniref:hypothetical protein n=1 Tax=Pseudomonas aeruginosa group TaxID=136841 RepID=UPI000A41FA7D|nr:hypothetical protein [Pseudomonas aeruginosa]